MQFQGKRILITGAGRGIGRAIAVACARESADLALVARTAKELVETAELAIAAGAASAKVFSGDVGNPHYAAEVFAAWGAGPIHGLVCAAAVMGEINLVEDSSLEEWEKTYRINVLGSLSFAQAAIRRMKDDGGRIIFFSGGGQGGQARRTAYAASKGAIWRLTESLAQEVVDQNIFVNAIAPGAVNTRFLQDVLNAGPGKAGDKDYADALKQQKSGGTPPEKAAELASYLMSERSAGLTGKILSAVWDPYEKFVDLVAMSKSDIYTVRRVIDDKGSTRFN